MTTPWYSPQTRFMSPAYWEAGHAQDARRIFIKDATIQEGEDALGVQFTWDDRLEMAERLAEVGVSEIKMPVYSTLEDTGRFIKDMDRRGITCRKSMIAFFRLPYPEGFDWKDAIKRRAELGVEALELGFITEPEHLVSDFAGELSKEQILDHTAEVIEAALDAGITEPGYGHAWGTSLRVETFLAFHTAAVEAGAKRIFVWDTNGIAVPTGVAYLVGRLKDAIGGIEVVYHGHNDLGLATANNLAAVEAGADWCDVTVNGLGDRSGNSALEEVVMVLALHGYETGIDLSRLYELSQLIQERSGAAVQSWKPIVGPNSCVEEGEGHYHIARNAINKGYPEHPMGYNPAIIGREYSNVFGSTTLEGALSWGSMLEIKLDDWGIVADAGELSEIRDALARRIRRQGYVSEGELRLIAEGVKASDVRSVRRD